MLLSVKLLFFRLITYTVGAFDYFNLSLGKNCVPYEAQGTTQSKQINTLAVLSLHNQKCFQEPNKKVIAM